MDYIVEKVGASVLPTFPHTVLRDEQLIACISKVFKLLRTLAVITSQVSSEHSSFKN